MTLTAFARKAKSLDIITTSLIPLPFVFVLVGVVGKVFLSKAQWILKLFGKLC